jgi:hypothetical protein
VLLSQPSTARASLYLDVTMPRLLTWNQGRGIAIKNRGLEGLTVC